MIVPLCLFTIMMKNNTKKIGAIVVALGIFTALLALFGCRKNGDTDAIDGGVVKRYQDPEAPKVIESTEIVSFSCEYSFYGFDVASHGGRTYTATAELENDKVNGTLDWHNNSGEGQKLTFSTDCSFMESLYEITSKYDFAKHNGYYHLVSGLPDMFGVKLSIKFASDEEIYASDNQGCFIEIEALEELTQLFSSMTGGEFLQVGDDTAK